MLLYYSEQFTPCSDCSILANLRPSLVLEYGDLYILGTSRLTFGTCFKSFYISFSKKGLLILKNLFRISIFILNNRNLSKVCHWALLIFNENWLNRFIIFAVLTGYKITIAELLTVQKLL